MTFHYAPKKSATTAQRKKKDEQRLSKYFEFLYNPWQVNPIRPPSKNGLPTCLTKAQYSYTTTIGATGNFFGLWQPGMSKYRGADTYTNFAAGNYYLWSVATNAHYDNPSLTTWSGIAGDVVANPTWFTSTTGWNDQGNKWMT